MVHVNMVALFTKHQGMSQSLLQRHTLITKKPGVNITVSLRSGEQACTDQSKQEKDKANSKSTASHVISPIVHFGSHPLSDCQRSEHMALKVAFTPHLLNPWPLSMFFFLIFQSSSKVLALCSRTHTYTYKLLVHFFLSLLKVQMHTQLGS